VLKSIDWTYVLMFSGLCTSAMIIPTIFLFKEPPRPETAKESFGATIRSILKKIWMVVLDWRFIIFILIYSLFWILYFQMFDSILYYVDMFVDATALDNVISPILNSIFGITWHFDVEHVTVINAMTIIMLQLIVSSIVKDKKALPTMVTGVSCAVLGMAILAISSNIWIFMLGIFIFSIGEMTAHPKYIAYLGSIAPPDKKATYMGFAFLYGVPGSFIGPILGAWLYLQLVDKPMISFVRQKLAEAGSQVHLAANIKIEDAMIAAKGIGLGKAEITAHAQTSELWLIFCGIGVLCVTGLLLYHKFIGAREASDVK
jgi:dipeptide/tripeptide permease